MTKTIFISILLIFMASAHGGSDNSFKNEITALYDFAPHTLSEKEIEGKSKLLDDFWKKVTNSPNKYIKLLRVELSGNNHSPYFYYDGSKLLLSISNKKEDKILALKGVQKSELKDIQGTDYFLTVTKLGLEGFDTADAAFHILSYPDFKAFIVQHALTLGQDYSLICMLMLINQNLYIDKALTRIKNETDATAMESLLKLLWYADTPEAIKAITSISTDTKHSVKIIEFAKKLADESGQKERVPEEKLNNIYKALGISVATTYNELKRIRKERFNRISDEAIMELNQLTFLMKRQRILKNSNY